jgi:WD40 repeat protein
MNLKGYSYTAELEKAAQHSRWSDHITENNVDAPKIKDDKDYPIEVNQFELKHSLTHLMEYSSTLYYLFASPDATQKKSKAEFALTLFSFKKSDGEYKKVQLKELKGTPSCIATSLLLSSEPSSRRKECKNEDDRTSRYKIVGLVGLKEGFIKVIEFSPSRSKNSKPTVSSHKLEQKEIVSILPGEHNFYDSKNICFILLEDSKVFIYNYLVKQVIAIYQPPILSHDFAVCMDIHCSGNYLATCTKSGQIFFWELNKMTFEAI